MTKEKVLTIILDGWGYREDPKHNGIAMANTPNFDKLWKESPHAILEAAGEAVGLPEGQMGTSEVNHMVIGSGRIMFQDLVKINKSIRDKSYIENPSFIHAFEHVKKNNSVLHIKGLISPGGVHSHQEHFYALLEAAKKHGLKKVYIHMFTDGRDTLPKSTLEHIKMLEKKIKEIGIGRIASISGRYYAMDRDHNWDRTDKTFDVLVKKDKGKKYKTATDAVEDFYKQGVTDEFIIPSYIEVDDKGEEGCIGSNDAVIFVNFRNDRTRQLTERFLEKGPNNLKYVTMSTYKPSYNVEVAFPQVKIDNILGQVISENDIKQLRIAETEKFAHLTFFMNCKREESFEGEDRILIDSYSDIKNHDERPEMRTPDIAKQIVQDMDYENHQVIFTNICNGDMVGHTGDEKAIIKGIETVDKALGDILKMAKKKNYHVIITADHGNAEITFDEKSGQPVSAHTTNPVPFILVSNKYKKINRETGGLPDVAPTILDILGLDAPKDMTGISFIAD